MIFKAKHFFHERSLHTTVHKLQGTSITLGHAGRKKYFNDFLNHFGQKMRLAFGSMTFQTFCIFWTGYGVNFNFQTLALNKMEKML